MADTGRSLIRAYQGATRPAKEPRANKVAQRAEPHSTFGTRVATAAPLPPPTRTTADPPAISIRPRASAGRDVAGAARRRAVRPDNSCDRLGRHGGETSFCDLAAERQRADLLEASAFVAS
jgi:hypothetical protein